MKIIIYIIRYFIKLRLKHYYHQAIKESKEYGRNYAIGDTKGWTQYCELSDWARYKRILKHPIGCVDY